MSLRLLLFGVTPWVVGLGTGWRLMGPEKLLEPLVYFTVLWFLIVAIGSIISWGLK